jgi:hypothetical protein
LSEGALIDRADQSRASSGIRDAAELAREIRRRAIEAHKVVNSPNAGIGELIKIRRQFEELLRVARGLSSQPTVLENWLRNAHLAIETKLRSGVGPYRGLLAS